MGVSWIPIVGPHELCQVSFGLESQLQVPENYKSDDLIQLMLKLASIFDQMLQPDTYTYDRVSLGR